MSGTTVIWIRIDKLPTDRGLVELGHTIGMHGAVYSIEPYVTSTPMLMSVIGIRTDEDTALALKLKYDAKTDEQFRSDMARYEEAIAEMQTVQNNVAISAAAIGRGHGAMMLRDFYGEKKPTLIRRILQFVGRKLFRLGA